MQKTLNKVSFPLNAFTELTSKLMLKNLNGSANIRTALILFRSVNAELMKNSN